MEKTQKHKNTHELIAQLAANAKAVVPYKMNRFAIELIAVTGLSFLINAWFFQLRGDLALQLEQPLYLLELAANFALILVTAMAAIKLGYPERAKLTYLKPLSLLLLVFYSVIILAYWVSFDAAALTTEIHPHGFECLVCIIAFAVVPMIWLTWRLRQLATLRPYHAAMMLSLFGLSLGCLGTRLIESGMDANTLLLWHYLPLLGLSMLSFLSGKIIFKNNVTIS